MTTAPGHKTDHVQVHTSEFDSGQTIFVQGDPGDQDEIAQLVGADRVSVNKALRNFTARGWILLDGKTVVIVNPEALARRADMGDSSGPDPNRRRRPLRATPDVRLGA